VDTDALAQRMLDQGYLLAPGALFHASRTPTTLMRINFCTTQNAQFWLVFVRERNAMLSQRASNRSQLGQAA
jgi:DNA-binding transcriptional MocR family regulator